MVELRLMVAVVKEEEKFEVEVMVDLGGGSDDGGGDGA